MFTLKIQQCKFLDKFHVWLQYGITSEGGGLHSVVAKCIYFGLFMFPVFGFSLAVAHLGGHRSVVVNCIYLDLFMFPLFVVCLCSAHLGGHRSVAAQGLPVNLQP